MGVDPAGGGEHRLLALTAQAAHGFAQGLADATQGYGGLCHFLEHRPQRQRRGMHQPQVQVGMGAAATAVDQGGLG
ncbi:hypothetical protein D3C84_948030 [compost metagenome]